MIKVGEKAPDFVLKDPDGNEVSLHSLLGDKSILLYFYHKDWSPVCTKQLSGFCSMVGDFDGLDMKIVAISSDHAFSHQAFREKLGADFLMLIATKEMLEKYGVYMESGFPKRAYFVLDKSGIIKFMTIMPNPGQMIENDELISIIRDLKDRMGF